MLASTPLPGLYTCARRLTYHRVGLAALLLSLGGCEELLNPPGNGDASLDGGSAGSIDGSVPADANVADAAIVADANVADTAVGADGAVSPADAATDADAGPISTPGTLSGFSTHALQAGDSREEDAFGEALALDGSGHRLVVGAPRGGQPLSDGFGNIGGAGRVFTFTDEAGTWTESQELRPPVELGYSQFGKSIAMDEAGQVLVVGAPGASVQTGGQELDKAGKVYVYRNESGQWVLDQELQSPTTDASKFFGWHVELSGDGSTLLAYDEYADGTFNDVRAYTRTGGTFQPFAGTVQGLADARYGREMAISYAGDVIALRASNRRLPDPYPRAASGAVDIYVRDGSDYRFVKTLLPDYPYPDMDFGRGLALSRDGRTLGVATDNYTIKEGCAEYHTRMDAYVFEGDGGDFARTAFYPALTSHPPYTDGDSRLAFDADASRLAISAPLEPAVTPTQFDAPHAEDDARGAVFLLARTADGWGEPHALKIAHPAPLVYGTDLALSASGERLVVGSSLNFFGYDDYPADPPLPPGWVWVHDVDAQADTLPIIAPTLPGSTTGCDATRPADLPPEVCWSGGADRANAALYCPATTCFDADQARSVPESAGASFACRQGTDCLALPQDFLYEYSGQADLQLVQDDLSIDLSFDLRLVADGYTLENFRRYVTFATARFSMLGNEGDSAETWTSAPADPTFSRLTPSGSVEFLSYDAGLLHVRIAGPLAIGRYTRDTPPYLCTTGTISLSFCEQVQCTYTSNDFGSTTGSGPSGWLEADVFARLPVR